AVETSGDYMISRDDAVPSCGGTADIGREGASSRGEGGGSRGRVPWAGKPGSWGGRPPRRSTGAGREKKRGKKKERAAPAPSRPRSEEHTPELQSRENRVCRL